MCKETVVAINGTYGMNGTEILAEEINAGNAKSTGTILNAIICKLLSNSRNLYNGAEEK